MERTATTAVSVIIPAKEDTPLLRRAIWSVRESADLPYELIVSPSAECVAANRNRGLARASHDLVAFVDDDVLLPSSWMSRLASVLAAHPKIGAVSAQLVFPDGSPQMRRHDLAPGELWEVTIPGTCFLYSRVRVHDLRFDDGYVGSQWEDTDWMRQVQRLGLSTVVCGDVRAIHDYKLATRPGLERNTERFREKWGGLPTGDDVCSISMEAWKAWTRPPLP